MKGYIMKRICKMLKTVLFAAVCMTVLPASADFSYKDCVVPFYSTQRIALTFMGKEEIFKFSSKKVTWRNNIKTDLEKAKLYKYNSDRVDMLDDYLFAISEQSSTEWEDFDSAIDEINTKSIEPAVNRNDLIWAIAMAYRLNNFCKGFIYKKLSDTDAVKEELATVLDSIKEKVRERYEDDVLKKLTAEYKKLFPNRRLLIDQSLPSNFNACVKLQNECLAAYLNLNKYSAAAEFEEWGANMLNFLLLEYDVLFIKEFETRLKNYTANFKIKK